MLFMMYQGFTFLDLITTIPGSMIFVILLATLTAFTSAGLTKLLVDTKELERKQKQIRTHKEEKEKIIELADIDVNKYRKERKRWERKDAMIKKTEQKMGFQRLKPTCVTAIPLMVIMYIFSAMFDALPVAISPMRTVDIPLLGAMLTSASGGSFLNYIGWYILCSFTMTSIIQRLLGIQSQTSGGQFGQMFSGQKSKALDFPNV